MKAKKNNEQNEKKAITELKVKTKLTSKPIQTVTAKVNPSSSSLKKPVINKTVKSSIANAAIKPKPVISKTSSVQINKDKQTALKSKTSKKDILVENNKKLNKAMNISSSKNTNLKKEKIKSSLANKNVVKIADKISNPEKISKSKPAIKQNTASKALSASKITNVKISKSVEPKVKPVLTKADTQSKNKQPDKNIKSSNKPTIKLPTATKTNTVQLTKQSVNVKKTEESLKLTPKLTVSKSTKKVTAGNPDQQIKTTKPASKIETKKLVQKQNKAITKPSETKAVNSIISKPLVKQLAKPQNAVKLTTKSITKSENKPVVQALKPTSLKPSTKPKTKEIPENNAKTEKINDLKHIKPSEPKIIKTETKEKTRAKSKPEVPEDLPYTDEQLSFYKQLLTKKREEFIQQVNGLRKKIKKALDQDNVYERNTGDPDSDYITESSEFAKDEILINRLEENIRDIDDALNSIEDRTYGYCQKTGKLIEEERLKTIPWARYCIMIQNEIESSS